jgi:hypothetical protein
LSHEVLQKAIVARCYGWTNEDIDSMEYNLFLEYYEAALALEARSALLSINTTSFVHLSKNDRGKLHKELHKKAYGLLDASDEKPGISLKNFVLGLQGSKLNG